MQHNEKNVRDQALPVFESLTIASCAGIQSWHGSFISISIGNSQRKSSHDWTSRTKNATQRRWQLQKKTQDAMIPLPLALGFGSSQEAPQDSLPILWLISLAFDVSFVQFCFANLNATSDTKPPKRRLVVAIHRLQVKLKIKCALYPSLLPTMLPTLLIRGTWSSGCGSKVPSRLMCFTVMPEAIFLQKKTFAILIHFGRIRRVTHFETKCPRHWPQNIICTTRTEIKEKSLSHHLAMALSPVCLAKQLRWKHVWGCLRMFEDHRSRLAPPEVVKSVWYRSIAA